ncbi:hypothetical protein CRE_26686 [Caenorhabditis remanei]|uniref:F-box domain-containing protein n=1 Tax=Caenorhabditis remanei TaxID=31234 RepID=E3MKZ5_CAERE|nr:hypothetical protein CRE_26686 [Caenorhabditis remanei]
MSTIFPLFRLPHVVLSEVFNLTTPDEIIKLSLCSKKAGLIIKYTSKKWRNLGRLKLVLRGTEPSTVQHSDCTLLAVSDGSAMKDPRQLVDFKIGEITVPVNISNMVTYWADKLEGVRSVMEYVMDILNSEIEVFDIKEDATSSEIHNIFQWMVERNTVFFSVDFDSGQTTSEDLNFFFQNIKTSGCLQIRGSPNRDYRNPSNSCFSSLKYFINIIDGFWLEKWHLNSLNCSIICLFNTSFSCVDMNVYLRKWKNGQAFSLLNIGFFESSDRNVDQLLDGLDSTEIPIETRREYRRVRIYMCSKKASLIIKYTVIKWRKKPGMILELEGTKPSVLKFYEHTLLSVSDVFDRQTLGTCKMIKIGNSIVPVETKTMMTYWGNKLKGVRNGMEHVMKIFSSEVQSYKISNDLKPDEIHWLFRWMASRNIVFTDCTLHFGQATIEDLNFFFQNIRFDSKVIILGKPPDGFQMPSTSFLGYPSKSVEVYNGNWLKISDIFSIESHTILLVDTPFSSVDMNGFLKRWKCGKATTRLKVGLFYTKELNLDDVFKDIEKDEVPKETRRTFKLSYDHSLDMEGGYDIKGHDEVIATICDVVIENGIHVLFMAVWPDWSTGEESFDECI